MFRDREDAGEQLATLLQQQGVETDVVLAIPRGGLPVGRAVADALGVPLDVIVARKLGAPGNPELAIGAVAPGAPVWVNDDLVGRIGVTPEYLERERERQLDVAREKAARYRGDRPLDLTGKRVLIVDDGVATGATTLACIRAARAAGASAVALGVPVASPRAVEMLRADADEVYAVETPAWFSAVGGAYRSFDQVSDAEALDYLDGRPA
jgi:putative phosphoribosyl transferase